MDKIFINKIPINTIIGIYQHELTKKQLIIVDLELETNISHTAKFDDIKYTVDYSKVTEYVTNLCEQFQFNLIETLAEFIAKNLLENFKTNWVRIKITKPQALNQTNEVGTIIERHKDAYTTNP